MSAGVLLLGLIAYVVWKRKAMQNKGKIGKKGNLSLDERVNIFLPTFF